MVFLSALGELRGNFGVHLAFIAVKYGIDVEEQLAAIFPAADEATAKAARPNKSLQRTRKPPVLWRAPPKASQERSPLLAPLNSVVGPHRFTRAAAILEVRMNRSRPTVTLDGETFSSFEEFCRELGTVYGLGRPWGGNMDAFHDILDWPSLNQAEEAVGEDDSLHPYVLVWKNAHRSCVCLGQGWFDTLVAHIREHENIELRLG